MERIKLSFNLKRSIRYENYGHILGSDAQNIKRNRYVNVKYNKHATNFETQSPHQTET